MVTIIPLFFNNQSVRLKIGCHPLLLFAFQILFLVDASFIEGETDLSIIGFWIMSLKIIEFISHCFKTMRLGIH